jgi:outer membrane immunogenic protein
MMRRFLALMAATAIVGLGGIEMSSAADLALPGKAPPPVATPWSWTGFYIGGNVGAGWGTTETTANVGAAVAPFIAPIPATLAFSVPISSQTVNGFLGGGQIGYNYQIGFVVLGVEGDLEWENLQGTSPCLGTAFALFCNTKHSWQADITGRVGVVAFDKALLYIKGGAVWQHSSYSASNSLSGTIGGVGFSAATSASASDTRLGALLGTGIEYGFLPNWSAKIEYNFEEFGPRTLNFPVTASACAGGACVAVPPPAINIPVSIKDFDHIIKAGVNYRW